MKGKGGIMQKQTILQLNFSMKEQKDMQEKYDFFLMIYKQGLSSVFQRENKWFNGKCERTKKKRDEA